jgi:hypothetical protein
MRGARGKIDRIEVDVYNARPGCGSSARRCYDHDGGRKTGDRCRSRKPHSWLGVE